MKAFKTNNNIIFVMNKMIRDATHTEQVERWANFVKTHPRSVWIKQVGPFVDSQIIMANRFYDRLAKTENGMEKIRKLRGFDDSDNENIT